MPFAIVTGSNRGIGLELCKQLKAAGYEILATCRKASKELRSLNIEIAERCEVRDFSAFQSLAKKLKGKKLDLLINNSGILYHENLENPNFDHILEEYEINAIGPLKVSVALLPLMKKGSKIVMISSRAGSIGNTPSGGLYGYRMSKAALNMLGVNMSVELKERGIAVGIFHPGRVSTAMLDFKGDITVEESVFGLMQRIEELSLKNTGFFVHSNGEEIPW